MSRVARLAIIVMVLFANIHFVSAIQAQTYYYRWSLAPAVTCSPEGAGVKAVFASQPVEWNLPAGASFSIVYIYNGVEVPSGPFPGAAGTSSFVYGALRLDFPAYPAVAAVRLETIVGGVIVYTSTMSTSCSADGVTTSTVVNAVPASGTAHTLADTCKTVLPASAVQGRMLTTLRALFAPRADTTTDVTLEAGTSWWVIGAQDGYYHLWIACKAETVWVPAEAMSPNYALPWGGAALPSSGS